MKKRLELLPTRHWILAITLIIFVIYIAFQARFVVMGAQVEILSPQNGDLVSDSIVDIKGKAKNIAWISLNGRQIFTDEKGNWSERLVVSPGKSIMTVFARDRFGHETTESIQIFAN